MWPGLEHRGSPIYIHNHEVDFALRPTQSQYVGLEDLGKLVREEQELPFGLDGIRSNGTCNRTQQNLVFDA